MTKIACVFVVTLAFGLAVSAQKETKPWTNWTQKDVLKILNDSAWGQTQVETAEASGSTSAVTSTTDKAQLNRDASKPGAGSVTGYIKYFLRFLSAKPIRQAVARRLQLQQPSMDPKMTEQLKTFAETGSGDFIVVSAAAEASDQKMGGSAMLAFNIANFESLKDVTYLERKDGQRLLLMDFRPPINDGLGAKFVFPRMLNKQPFINDSAGEVRFHCQLSKAIKLTARFKVSEMVYDGKLEY
jgi:hypothetical protein